MIAHLGNLAVWEWFKLRRRGITWILLGLLMLFSALTVWVRFADYQFKKDAAVKAEVAFLVGTANTHNVEWDIECPAFLAGRSLTLPPGFTTSDIDEPRTRERCRQAAAAREDQVRVLEADFTLPGSIPKAMRWTHLFGIPLLAFFTVLTLGSEYGWGTLRTVLMAATGRWQYFSVKLGVIAVASLCAWLLVLVTIVISSLMTSALAGAGDTDFLGPGFFGDMAADTGRAWFAGLPYVALAALVTVLFTTSSIGGMFTAMVIGMGYYLVELSAVGRLLSLFDGVSAFKWFDTAVDYGLGWNTAAWMLGDEGAPIAGFALGGTIGSARYPGELHAFLILVAYAIVLGGLAFWLFYRKDVTGPSGG